jgi:hypothetical protein
VAPTPHARQTSRTMVWVEEMRFDGLASVPFWSLVSAPHRVSRGSRIVASSVALLLVGTCWYVSVLQAHESGCGPLGSDARALRTSWELCRLLDGDGFYRRVSGYCTWRVYNSRCTRAYPSITRSHRIPNPPTLNTLSQQHHVQYQSRLPRNLNTSTLSLTRAGCPPPTSPRRFHPASPLRPSSQPSTTTTS